MTTGRWILLFSGVLVVVLIGLMAGQLASVTVEPLVIFGSVPSPHRVAITAEIADTFLKQQAGLTGVEGMPQNYGMLLLFQESGRRFFRTRDYRMSLDILFLDREGRITTIVPEFPPCGQVVCPYADSIDETKAILLLNAGFAFGNGIREGDFVSLPAGA